MINLFFRLFSSIVLLMLSACGSGSTSPHITDIEASQIIYGQATQFRLSGGALNGSVIISAQGCSSTEVGEIESDSKIA
jgi:hypothetical protein